MHTLLLNSDYTPFKVVTWQKAMNLVFRGAVEVVEEYEDVELKSVSLAIKCPSILRLKRFVNMFGREVKFSKLGIFSRDNFTCQYCGEQPGSAKLTFDHILPRSRGGRTEWTNVITACSKCNSKKSDRTPEEAKMPLRKKAYKPDSSTYIKLNIGLPKTPDGWVTYLNWNKQLVIE